ncbi:hypothetical protein [Pedobacter sp. MR2016-24]|uniref:hypothetical protein n=1 Tax=Pedobacter sp. MR2016-24 TaxID=2994466 RepID=UPI0022467551|nr:hypothetical protein [Pedobacter sp. MR2016-24]MCX2484514.1 hypothetical protein [Pedobacter sp. MR2016-24]
MSENSVISDQQRIRILEDEILNMRKLFVMQIERIEAIIGIGDDFERNAVKSLDKE